LDEYPISDLILTIAKQKLYAELNIPMRLPQDYINDGNNPQNLGRR